MSILHHQQVAGKLQIGYDVGVITLPRKHKLLLSLLLLAVLVTATLQLVRDLQVIRWDQVFADFPGIEIENQLAAERDPDPSFKLGLINDNYHRCQNKLGVTYVQVADGGVVFRGRGLAPDTPEMDAEMRKLFVAGVKYLAVHINSYSPADVANLTGIVKAAAKRQITAILLPRTYTPDDPVTQLAGIYTQISTQAPGVKFIVAPVPDLFAKQSLFKRSIEVATAVAARLKDNPNIIVGTPVLTANDDLEKDRIEQYKEEGLDLAPFDFLLVEIDNTNSGFDSGTGQAKYRSQYNKTAYYAFAEVVKDKHYRAREWLSENNNARYRQQMQAIVLDFGPRPGTFSPANGTLSELTLQRIEDDLGRFGIDPDVRAVVFRGLDGGYSLNDAQLSRLNLILTNCNYDIEDSEYEYLATAQAPVCTTTKSATVAFSGDGATTSGVVCNRVAEICGGELIYTIQLGLPIKQFGSNTPAGTDTNPYQPVASLVGNFNYAPYINPFNQFGQRLEVTQGKEYVIPWLGSALYNSAELLRVRFFAFTDQKFLNQIGMNDSASAAEFFGELKSDYAFDQPSVNNFRTKTTWCFDGIRQTIFKTDLEILYDDAIPNSKVITPDEFALYKGKGFCVTKDKFVDKARGFQSYDPVQYATEFDANPVCGDTIVKQDPQNMIYGSEQVIKKERWFGSPEDLCYQTWQGADGLIGSPECRLLQRPKDSKNPELRCACQETLKGRFVAYTEQNVRQGACSLSGEQISECIEYIRGADSMSSTQVKLVAKEFPASIQNYEIPGAYAALASLYNHVQTQFSQRGLKLVFNEDWGWRSDAVVRAYMNAPGPDSKIPNGRKNLMLDNPVRDYKSVAEALGVPASQPGAPANQKPVVPDEPESEEPNSCRIGVNFATYYYQLGDGEINEAAKLGYGLGLAIINGPGDPEQVRPKLRSMCQQGITPVIRSCVLGGCDFDGGAQQAETLNQLTDVAECGEIVVTCGHNEPVPEYEAGMVAEGQWTRDCVANINTRGGKVKVTTPTFNATFGLAGGNDRDGDGIETVLDHARDFLSGYGTGQFNSDRDSGKLSCLAFNTYDNVGGQNADYYYDRIQQIPEFASMDTCIMETGNLESNLNSDISDLISRLSAKAGFGFLLGFNWMNTNPGWEQFALDDKGKAVLEAGCGDSALLGDYFSRYQYYLAMGKNWELNHQYYEMLGYIDELVRLNDILASTGILKANEIKVVDGVPIVTDETAGLFAGWFGCGSDAHRALGQKSNCIGVISDADPLGDFLCQKGYVVGGNCQSQCIAEPSEAAKNSESTIKTLSQLQPSLVNLTQKIEQVSCLPRGILVAMMEREITSSLPSLQGDVYQRLYPKKRESQVAWGPAMFTNIAWSTGTNPAHGKATGNGFNWEYGTKKCLDALGIDYPRNGLLEETGAEYVLDRTVLGYALCGAASKLKMDSGTENKCTNWTQDELFKAAKSYLGNCADQGREYCSVYKQTICNIYPGQNPALCGELDTDQQYVCLPPVEDKCADGQIRLLHPLGKEGPNARVSQKYGNNDHSGTDYSVSMGTPVYAAAAGTVKRMENNWSPAIGGVSGAAGNYVVIQHGGKRLFWTSYQHFMSVAPGIEIGSQVEAGQLIGFVGSTGRSTGPHLHFELRLRDCYDGYGEGKYKLGQCSTDPEPYILGAGDIGTCKPTAPSITGEFACPIKDPGGTLISQSSFASGGRGSHARDDIKPQQPTDIGAAGGKEVVAPIDGTITEVRSPVDTVNSFGEGICDFIQLPDGPGNDFNPSDPNPDKRGINYRVIQANGLVAIGDPSQGLFGKGGKVYYDAKIDDEGFAYYDGGFVVHLQDAEGKLWRLVHLEDVQVKLGQNVKKGEKVGVVYDGKMEGEWAAYSAKGQDGSGCWSIPHLHFAIISPEGANNPPTYSGNTIDSTPWVKQYCGIQ